jgi:hypothetical protein
MRADPPIDEPAIVPNLKSRALDRFDQVEIFVSRDLAQHDIADLQSTRVADWFDCAELAGFDLAGRDQGERFSGNVTAFVHAVLVPCYSSIDRSRKIGRS